MRKIAEHVYRRESGGFVFRRRYPRDLAHCFAGAPERWTGIVARTITDARRIGRALSVAFDREMRALRQGNAGRAESVLDLSKKLGFSVRLFRPYRAKTKGKA